MQKTHLIKMDFHQARQSIADHFAFSKHPYHDWASDITLSREAFLSSQKGFIHAVEGFPCALSAVVSKMPRFKQRIAVVENVWEEHGHGLLADSHASTFSTYLKALGAIETGPDEIDLPSHVLLFNETIRNYCLANPPEAGAALLGMIEYQYIEISRFISRLIVDRKWVSPGTQSHYATHETLDVQHAEDLFAGPKEQWKTPEYRTNIIEGMMVGAHSFWNLYRDMVGNETR